LVFGRPGDDPASGSHIEPAQRCFQQGLDQLPLDHPGGGYDEVGEEVAFEEDQHSNNH